MSRKTKGITLSTEERAELSRMVRTHTITERTAEIAQIILWGAEAHRNGEVAQRLRTCAARICKWCPRFVRERLEGLLKGPRSGPAATLRPSPYLIFSAKLRIPNFREDVKCKK